MTPPVRPRAEAPPKAPAVVPAERVARVVRLRPEAEVTYRRLHAEIWPEVARALRRAGIGNYSIFLRDGLLFSYYEYTGSDHAADLATMAADPHVRRWWELTGQCQQPVDSAVDTEWWAAAEEVFHLD